VKVVLHLNRSKSMFGSGLISVYSVSKEEVGFRKDMRAILEHNQSFRNKAKYMKYIKRKPVNFAVRGIRLSVFLGEMGNLVNSCQCFQWCYLRFISTDCVMVMHFGGETHDSAWFHRPFARVHRWHVARSCLI
jgi:hypothetical protein